MSSSENPLLVSSQQVMSTGIVYVSDAEEKKYEGNWSDGICDCLSDLNSCLLCLMHCLQPVLLFETIGRMQRAYGRAFQLPFGLQKISYVAWLYAAGIGVILFAPHFAWTGWILVARILYDVYKQTTDIYKIPDEGCQGACMACCMHSCLLARISRHVGRARGYIPPIMGFRVEAAHPVIDATTAPPTVVV
jgi:hypothetical protein